MVLMLVFHRGDPNAFIHYFECRSNVMVTVPDFDRECHIIKPGLNSIAHFCFLLNQ